MKKRNVINLLVLIFIGSAFYLRIEAQPADNLTDYFASKATPFNTADDLDPIVQSAGNRKLVLLGEASHGTHEYYHWRSELSKKLIQEHGFGFIVVEGDWASIYRLNKYVKGLDSASASALDVLRTFDRWPQWMWANTDVAHLAEWLREYNAGRPLNEMVGFYGMDVYGQWEAMEDLLEYTREHLPHRHDEISRNLNCFAGFGSDEWQYARAVAAGQAACSENLERVVEILRNYETKLAGNDPKGYFRAKQNALVMKNAESFYRLAVGSSAESWNSRVDHMWLTVQRLLQFHGDDAKGIVWAHNTHVGDSRATTMALHNQYNIGSLSRAELGEQQVYIIGFGTRTGTVNAGSQWGAAMQVMRVPEAQPGSLDHYLGMIKYPQFFMRFQDADRQHPLLAEPLGHRVIGVTYNPRREAGNYVPTLPAWRYDALIFFQQTRALNPVK